MVDLAALADWLDSLPKPAAVMAVHDLRATHVLEAAILRKIKVPEQLPVIGVDNDELLCETAEPTLTSIAPDHVRLGELAAATLKSVMARPLAHHAEKLSATKTIVERQSARHIVPAAQLVERISAYIHHNATKGIGAADVVRQLGVSRRLAETRFKQITGGTILDAILATRLAVLKRRLHETDTPIAKLSAGCGFKCENYAKRLFKNRFGVSMSEWRKALAAT
jgi:LacI family transcriptional regulator